MTVKTQKTEDTITTEQYEALSEAERAEYEPIEELSKKTLGSYIEKSTDEVRPDHRVFKRNKGIKMAVKKLTKEETDSASSLHPAAKSVDDPKSKLDYMTRVIGAMNAACSDDLEKWYRDSIEQVGHEADGVGDVSGKNQDSVDMKPSNAVSGERAKLKMPMPKLGDTGDQDETEPSKRSHPGSMPMVKIDAREDVENLFSGEDLSEEFKADAVTLFETALNARVMLEAERIREEVEAEYSKEIESFTNELTDRLDSYLEYAVESWMGENQLAIESTLRTELSTELVEALADVLREHYVTVPDGATDALEAMAGRVAELEGKLNETVNELVRTRSGNREAVKASIIEAAAEGLTLLSSEKLKTLVEQLEFDGDEEAFAKRVLLVKERFVDVKEVPHDTGLFSESFEGDPDDVAPTDPAMRAYVDSLGSLARE